MFYSAYSLYNPYLTVKIQKHKELFTEQRRELTIAHMEHLALPVTMLVSMGFHRTLGFKTGELMGCEGSQSPDVHRSLAVAGLSPA